MPASLSSFSAKKLDSSGIVSYTNDMENLVKTIKKLNAVSKRKNININYIAGGTIRASGDSMRKSRQADAVGASGSNQSGGQTNVNAPTNMVSNKSSHVINNTTSSHMPKPQSEVVQMFLSSAIS